VHQVPYIDPSQVNGGEPGDTVLGTFDRQAQTIELLKSVPWERRQIVFLHECLHGWGEGLDLSEDQIDELAWRIYDTLSKLDFRFGPDQEE
jgi:hypothetical protein